VPKEGHTVGPTIENARAWLVDVHLCKGAKFARSLGDLLISCV